MCITHTWLWTSLGGFRGMDSSMSRQDPYSVFLHCIQYNFTAIRIGLQLTAKIMLWCWQRKRKRKPLLASYTKWKATAAEQLSSYMPGLLKHLSCTRACSCYSPVSFHHGSDSIDAISIRSAGKAASASMFPLSFWLERCQDNVWVLRKELFRVFHMGCPRLPYDDY
jgi:hypothetical protein